MFPFPSMLLGAGGRIQTTTWNPSDKNAGITLSGGNLTATGSGTPQGVRATTSKSAGLWGYTATFNGANNGYLGFANASSSLSGVLGSTTNGVGIAPGGGNVSINGSVIGTGAAIGATSVVDVVADFTNKLFWFRVDGGNWNNNPSASPFSGVGGFSLATLATGPYFPDFTCNSTGVGITADFFRQTYPTGVRAWDAAP